MFKNRDCWCLLFVHLLNDHASNELEMVSDEKLEQNKDGKQAKKED